jgi:hypothetical protein
VAWNEHERESRHGKRPRLVLNNAKIPCPTLFTNSQLVAHYSPTLISRNLQTRPGLLRKGAAEPGRAE